MHNFISRRPLFHILLIALLGLLVYSNTFNVPFQFDDKKFILENPSIKNFDYFIDPSRIDDIDLTLDIKRLFKTRYVSLLTLWANYKFGGLNVIGYHVVNLGVHVVNALLVYIIVHLTFRTPFLNGSRLKEQSWLVALFSGLLFVTHPVQTMAITYILQRCASLTAMFYMLSLVIYAKWRIETFRSLEFSYGHKSKIWKKTTSLLLYFFSLLSCVIAMKTKEIAFTLPMMLVLYDILFFRDELKKSMLYLSPFLLSMLIIPLEYIGINMETFEYRAFDSATRFEWAPDRLDYVLSQFGVISTYIRLLFMPIGQSMYYEDMVRHSFSEPGVFLPFLFLLFVFFFGLYMLHRSRKGEPALRLVSFGIFWFFLSLSVESSVFPISDVIDEYRVYLPSTGAFMAVVSGAYYLTSRFRSMGRKAVACAACAAVVVLAGGTYARNTVWQSQSRLFEDTVRKAPGNARGHFFLGKAYVAEGLVEKAIGAYTDCIKLFTDAFGCYNNLGLIYSASGMTDLAIEHYKIAIELLQDDETVMELLPDYGKIYNNIAAAYWAKGMAGEAIEYFERALKIDPDLKDTHINVGAVYLETGYVDKALEHFETAVRLDPDNASAHNELGTAYESKGLFEEAVEQYSVGSRTRTTQSDKLFQLGQHLPVQGAVRQCDTIVPYCTDIRS
jgi:tetratricopeptide (TPR) repeat protein